MVAASTDAPFRIAIDARPFGGPPCGYVVYLSSIIACLRAADVQVTLLSNRPLLARHEAIAGLDQRVFGSAADLRWEQTSLPELLAQERFDVYFVGANRGIPVRKCPATRYVLGLLDIIPYLFWRQYLLGSFVRRASRSWIIRETLSQLVSLARADAVLTISQQSADDIRRIFRRRATAFPIRLAARDVVRSDTVRPQFAYVGGVDHRKRVDVLIRAFHLFSESRPDYRLVLIGANYSAVEPLITDLGLTDRVVLTGFIDDAAKYRILSESIAMVYPSLYEGYGLAIAEGFQAGIAVIAGPGGSQAEVGGDAIRRIDPMSPGDIAAAMVEMLDPATRDAWVRRGQAQLLQLSDPAIEQRTQNYFRDQAVMARAWLSGGAGRVPPAASGKDSPARP